MYNPEASMCVNTKMSFKSSVGNSLQVECNNVCAFCFYEDKMLMNYTYMYLTVYIFFMLKLYWSFLTMSDTLMRVIK